MSTNYYVAPKPPCECCGRPFDAIHIGNSAIGWKFLFADHPDLGLSSWKGWRAFLDRSEAIIKDEYGRSVEAAELISLIESKQAGNYLTAFTASDEQWGSSGGRDRYERLDEDGYRFAIGKFS